MNGIIGMSHLALSESDPSRSREHIERIKESAERLTRVLNDILDYSKIEAGKISIEKSNFDLRGMIDDAVSTIRPQAVAKELEFIVSVPAEIPMELIGDSIRTGQILLNYLSNAVKFTERGRIEVSVVPEQAGDDGTVLLRFVVADTGIGLTSKQQASLFTSFTQADASTTRKFGGTGLGLFICKSLAQLMGGDVGVDSTSGRGSTFWFTVRFQIAESGPAAKPPSHTATRGSFDYALLRGTRVLLAEDDKTNQLVASGLLEAVGIKVDIAENGSEAVDKVMANDYELVLMDMQMPIMGGLEATGLIRHDAKFKNLPILAMTANAMQQHRQECLEAGMNDFVPKPFEPSQLYAIIQKWVIGQGDGALFHLSQAPPPETSHLPVDVEGIDLRAGLRRVAGMTALYLKTLRGFVEQQDEVIFRLQQSMADGDVAAATREAHSLKGAAGMIDAHAISASAANIEAALNAQDLQQGIALIDELESELPPLLDALRYSILPETNPATTVEKKMNLVQLVWRRQYESGFQRIDDQHKAIFTKANVLLDAVIDERPEAEIAALISDLNADVVAHFADEEDAFLAAGFEGAEDHAGLHRMLVDKALQLSMAYSAGTLALGDLFSFLVYDVAAKHMLVQDRKFFPCLAAAKAIPRHNGVEHGLVDA